MKLSITVPITYILGSIAEAAIVFSGGMSTPLTCLSLALVAWVCLWTHLTAVTAVRQYMLAGPIHPIDRFLTYKRVLKLTETDVVQLPNVPRLPFGLHFIERNPVRQIRLHRMIDGDNKATYWKVVIRRVDQELALARN